MVQNSTFIHKIYKGFDTRHNIEPTMWREILRIINEATVDGLSQGKVLVHEDDFLSAPFLTSFQNREKVCSNQLHSNAYLIAKPHTQYQRSKWR